MATSANSLTLASQARRLYAEELVKGLAPLGRALVEAMRHLRDKPGEPAVAQRVRDAQIELERHVAPWQQAVAQGLRRALNPGPTSSRPGDLSSPGPSSLAALSGLSLVDDDTIEREILSSRLSLAIMDRASWEFADLRSRV